MEPHTLNWPHLNGSSQILQSSSGRARHHLNLHDGCAARRRQCGYLKALSSLVVPRAVQCHCKDRSIVLQALAASTRVGQSPTAALHNGNVVPPESVACPQYS